MSLGDRTQPKNAGRQGVVAQGDRRCLIGCATNVRPRSTSESSDSANAANALTGISLRSPTFTLRTSPEATSCFTLLALIPSRRAASATDTITAASPSFMGCMAATTLATRSSATARSASAKTVYGSAEGTDGRLGITGLDGKDTHGHAASESEFLSMRHAPAACLSTSPRSSPEDPSEAQEPLRSSRQGQPPSAPRASWACWRPGSQVRAPDTRQLSRGASV